MASREGLLSDSGIQDVDDDALLDAVADETLPVDARRNAQLELRRRMRAGGSALTSRPPTRPVDKGFDPQAQTKAFRKWHSEPHDPVDMEAIEAEVRKSLTPRAELELAQRQNAIDAQASAFEVFKTAAQRMFPHVTDEADGDQCRAPQRMGTPSWWRRGWRERGPNLVALDVGWRPVSASIPAPPDIRRAVQRDFAGTLAAWIASLKRDAKLLHLRGCPTFAAECTRMAREAEHVLEVLAE